jgi:hypothetical protein
MNAKLSTAATFVKAHMRLITFVVAFTFVFALIAMPSMGVMAQSSDTIDIDLGPLFTSINTWIPAFLPIIAIGGGISIAIAIGLWIVNLIKSAVSGAGARK